MTSIREYPPPVETSPQPVSTRFDIPLAGRGSIVTSWPMAAGTQFDLHRHDAHQLCIAALSAIAIGVAGRTWVLPRGRALWVPAGVEHSVRAVGPAEMTAIWFDPVRCPIEWSEPTAVSADGLVTMLVDRLLAGQIDDAAQTRTEAVLFDVLVPVETDALDLVMPLDSRARAVAEALLVDPSDNRSLVGWGRVVGASDRTLMRAFVDGTGIGFHEWRSRARVTAALGLLLTDLTIATIATLVGYSTTSAFGAAFRRVMGVAPSRYRLASPKA